MLLEVTGFCNASTFCNVCAIYATIQLFALSLLLLMLHVCFFTSHSRGAQRTRLSLCSLVRVFVAEFSSFLPFLAPLACILLFLNFLAVLVLWVQQSAIWVCLTLALPLTCLLSSCAASTTAKRLDVTASLRSGTLIIFSAFSTLQAKVRLLSMHLEFMP
jgi:hypothetical protein